MTVAVVVFLCFACGAIDNDELDCEQAVSKLQDCCPGLDTRALPCVDSAGGCSRESKPTLTQTASACVLDKTCSDDQTGGLCARVIAFSVIPESQRDNGTLEAEVCQ